MNVCFYKQMEEKKGSSGGRMVGSKVSQIANIFQAMTPVKGEGEVSPVEASKSTETNVTVVRTESHVARFNNARALFEKLGEFLNSVDNKSVFVIVSLSKDFNSTRQRLLRYT